MPNTYAHYRFGQEILRSLPEEKQHALRKNLPLYLIGQHGPDILFYYHPLRSNEINAIGYSVHEWTGSRFFTQGAEIVRNSENPEASYAYLAGFLCHFALDSTCHPYIEKKFTGAAFITQKSKALLTGSFSFATVLTPSHTASSTTFTRRKNAPASSHRFLPRLARKIFI